MIALQQNFSDWFHFWLLDFWFLSFSKILTNLLDFYHNQSKIKYTSLNITIKCLHYSLFGLQRVILHISRIHISKIEIL